MYINYYKLDPTYYITLPNYSWQVKNTFLDYETDCTPLGQRLTVRCKCDLFIGAPLVNLRHVRVCELEAMVYLVR